VSGEETKLKGGLINSEKERGSENEQQHTKNSLAEVQPADQIYKSGEKILYDIEFPGSVQQRREDLSKRKGAALRRSKTTTHFLIAQQRIRLKK